MSRNPRLDDLTFRRSQLKHARRFQEAILLQVQIIELLEAESAPENELAMAHNMASVLFLSCKQYSDAEWHARRTLSLHTGDSLTDHEACGAYNLIMARIFASRFEFEEALAFGERSIAEYSRFHNPPDEFLSQILAEIERMKNRTWSLQDEMG